MQIKSNMADINPTISIMTLNVKGLNTLLKSRDCQPEFFKKETTRSNYRLSIGDTLQIQRL